MGTYARVTTANGGAILEHANQPGFDPTVGTEAGTKWVPLIPEEAGSGPVEVSTTESVVMGALTYEGRQFDRKVARVTTYREKTPEEIEADKDQLVDDAAQFELLNKVNFRVVNEIQKLKGLAELTPQQYKQFLRSLL